MFPLHEYHHDGNWRDIDSTANNMNITFTRACSCYTFNGIRRLKQFSPAVVAFGWKNFWVFRYNLYLTSRPAWQGRSLSWLDNSMVLQVEFMCVRVAHGGLTVPSSVLFTLQYYISCFYNKSNSFSETFYLVVEQPIFRSFQCILWHTVRVLFIFSLCYVLCFFNMFSYFFESIFEKHYDKKRNNLCVTWLTIVVPILFFTATSYKPSSTIVRDDLS